MSFINELLSFVQLIEEGIREKKGLDFITYVEEKAKSLGGLDDFEAAAQDSIDALVALCKNSLDPNSPTALTVEAVGALGKLFVDRWGDDVANDTKLLLINIQKRLENVFNLLDQHLDKASSIFLQPIDIGLLIRNVFADIGWKSAGEELGLAADVVVSALANIAWDSIEDFLTSGLDSLQESIVQAVTLLEAECKSNINQLQYGRDHIDASDEDLATADLSASNDGQNSTDSAVPDARNATSTNIGIPSDTIDTSDAALPLVLTLENADVSVLAADAVAADNSVDTNYDDSTTVDAVEAAEVEIKDEL